MESFRLASGHTYGQEPLGMADGCVHHWMFDPPKGNTSIGVCKLCGDTVKNLNYFDSYNRPHNLVKRDKARDKGKLP